MNKFNAIVDEFKKSDGLEIKFKNESRLMKLIGFLMFFNKGFMESYITTLGSTVYFPSRVWLEKNSATAHRVLCHELMHILDARKVGKINFSLLYLFPQVLGALSLLSVFFGPWFLLFLLFLAPVPAPFRAYWELRGYAVTDATLYDETGRFANADWLVQQFTSSNYYFMWPFKTYVMAKIENNRKDITSGDLHKRDEGFRRIMKSFVFAGH